MPFWGCPQSMKGHSNWQSFSGTIRKQNATLRRARRTISNQPVPTSIHRKGMKQVILENISEGFQQTGGWSGGNLTKFKEKWQVPPLGRNNSSHFCDMRETKKAETSQPGKRLLGRAYQQPHTSGNEGWVKRAGRLTQISRQFQVTTGDTSYQKHKNSIKL